jgi:hypothetical protein
MCPFVAIAPFAARCTKVVTIETALIRDPHLDPAVFRQTIRRVVARDRRHIRHANKDKSCSTPTEWLTNLPNFQLDFAMAWLDAFSVHAIENAKSVDGLVHDPEQNMRLGRILQAFEAMPMP